MSKKLQDVKIAMLLCDGFEESEMTKPRKALEKAGAIVHLITPKGNKVKAFLNHKWSKSYPIDVKLANAKSNDYDAIVLPGGVINPDTLRTSAEAVNFVKAFFKSKKLVAAICHGPLTLVETKNLKSRNLTSYHSIKTDLINAGARWKNKEVVVDRNLITSRQPKDIPAFNEAIISYLVKNVVK
jgi:protease I